MYKIFIIGNNPFELVSVYQNPEITNSLSVVLKALISLTIPYDYLSLQYELFNFNLSLIFYLVILLTVITVLIYTLIKNKNVFSIIYILFLFLICIAPNLVAGYFRPQLVLIPFVIINLFLFLILSDLNFINTQLKVFVSILLFCWTYQSYILINDWKYAYDVSLKDSKQMCETNFNFEDGKTKLIIGLPSRYKQTHMLDYATGHYTYYCEKKFMLKNIVTDIIHTGALDKNSIDAELKLNIISNSEFEIKSTGTTQFLLKLDLIEKNFRDKDLEIVFSEYNSFNKPTKANVKLLSDISDLYLLNNQKFTKLNY
ncbi:MAG: hypothetical protein LH629_09945 [Ignavibacteria bacterium]|nr:hypothetical protein [Ignavibacteria bacterium]